MAHSVRISPCAILVLSALAADARRWRHGWSLASETGLKSGTIYPLLIRLAQAGLLEARWEASEGRGRPPRHAYRIVGPGLVLAKKFALSGKA